MIDFLRRLFHLPRSHPGPVQERADQAIAKADRVLAEFRRTEEAMRGKRRVP